MPKRRSGDGSSVGKDRDDVIGGNDMARSSRAQAWAAGGTIFAATMLIIIGLFQILEGLAAVFRNSFFVVGANYWYHLNTTAFGWIHFGIGVAAVLAGFFLFTGSTFARAIAIALVSLSAIANFFFVPYYPLWSLLLIAIDIFVIWAIASVRLGVPEGYDTAQYRATGAGSAFGSDVPQTGERWPTESQTTGRHYQGEPAKEGTVQGQPMTEAERAAQQRAMSGGRGQQPPPPPMTPPSEPQQ